MEDDHGHRATYDRSAPEWHAARQGRFPERAWIERLVAALPPRASVLDLGCGSGHPIAAHLLRHGYAVTGLDLSDQMLAIARDALPAGRWIQGDMRLLALREVFAAVIAWDSFFHLTAGEQRAAITRIAAHLAPGGLFLATVGPDAGTAWGAVSGGPVHHASLSPAGYAMALEEAGLILRRFVAEDPDTARRSVILARKRG